MKKIVSESEPSYIFDEIFNLVKRHANVLWILQGDVESATVVLLNNGIASLCWNEGQHNRSADVPLMDLLAVCGADAPEINFGFFTGTFHILPAGRVWLANQSSVLH